MARVELEVVAEDFSGSLDGEMTDPSQKSRFGAGLIHGAFCLGLYVPTTSSSPNHRLH